MGFMDAVGDAFDAVQGASGKALGTVIDIARTVGSDPIKYGSLPIYFAERGNDRNITQPVAELPGVRHGLAAIQGAYSYGVARPVSTAEQVTGGSMFALAPTLLANALTGQDRPSLSQAWTNSAKTSPGQSALLNNLRASDSIFGRHDAGGLTFENAYRAGQRGTEQFDAKFSMASGAMDAALGWFADPLVVVGKGAKVAQASRGLRSADIAAVRGDDLSRLSPSGQKRAIRVRNEFDEFIAGTDGLRASELMQTKPFRESSQGAALASLFAKADGDHELKRLVWRTAMSDEAAKAELASRRADIAAQYDRMTADLDSIVMEHEFITADGGGLFDHYNNADEIKALQDEIQSSRHVRDMLDRAVGTVDDETANTIADQQKVGVYGAVASRARITKKDRARISANASYTVQDGVGGVPVRVLRSQKDRRPEGWVDLHDAEQGFSEMETMLARVRGLDPADRRGMLDSFVHAADDNSRSLVIQGIENRVFRHIGDKLGYEPEAIEALLKKVQGERHIAVSTYKERAYAAATDAEGVPVDLLRLEDGTAVHRPLYETQLDNAVPTLDVDHIYRVLKTNASRVGALRAAGGKAWYEAEHGLDLVNDLWKLSVLLRGGYLVRNVMDSQFRLLGHLGGMEYAVTQLANVGAGIRRKWSAVDAMALRGTQEQRLAAARAELSEKMAGKPVKSEPPVRLYRGSHEPLDPARIPDEGARFTTQRDYAEQYGGDQFLYELDVPQSKMMNTTFGDALGDGPLPHTLLDRETAAQARLIRAPEGHAGTVHPETPVPDVDAGFANRVDDDPELSALLDKIDSLETSLKGGVDPDSLAPHFGQGEVAIGEYRVGDALGRTSADYERHRKMITSQESYLSLATNESSRLLNGMRGSGDWRVVGGSDPGYTGSYLRLVNRVFRQSEIAMRLIKGDSPQQVSRWLRSSEGRSVRRRMVHRGDTPEQLVEAAWQNLNHVVPDGEMRAVLADRPLQAGDVDLMFPSAAARPPINAEQVAFSMGHGPVAERLDKIRNGWFRAMNSMPDDVLGRHPMYRQMYRGRIRQLLTNADPSLSGRISPADQRVLEEQSRIWARREMKRYMFDVSSKSNLAHWVRFVSPFFSAWEDTMVKYGRMIVRDPSVVPRAWQGWTAPNDSSIFEVVDADGNPVDSKDSTISDGEFMRVPAKFLGDEFSQGMMDIPKSGFNVVLQGDPWWLPGFGPMVQAPVNEIAKGRPELADAVSYILPYGTNDESSEAFQASTLKNLRTLFKGNEDKQYARVMVQIMQTEKMRYANGLRDDMPTPGEIKKRTNRYWMLRAFTSATSPAAVQYKSPYQFYIDEAHRYQEKYGFDADQKFLEDYGQDYFLFTTSLSKNRTGVASSSRADKAARRVSDLIAAHPDYGWFFIGPDNTGDFSRNVYTAQNDRKISPLSNETWRGTQTPQEAMAKNNAELGWIEYQKLTARLEAVRIARGLPSMAVAGAADLREIKSAWLDRVTDRENGPAWGRDWQNDYEARDSGTVRRFLEAARAATTDPRISDRKDIRTMATYLKARDAFRAVLAQREQAGGSSNIGAQANADLAAVWTQITGRLVDYDVTFGDVFSRTLESDDLLAAA